MQVFLNLIEPTASSIDLDGILFSQAQTELDFSIDPTTETLKDGTSCALLTAQGKTLAHALINANKAVLDTSTVECYDFTNPLPLNGCKDAFLVIGESTKPLAIIPVQVARNYLADIAPPSATAPIYPTSQELQAILETLQQAIDRVGEIENIVEGFDEEVTKGVDQVNSATDDGIKSINESIEGFGTQVQEATTTITQQTNAFATQLAVEKQAIEQAVEDAEAAKEGAEQARDEAVIALNNGCVYEVREVTDANLALDKTLTAYKHTPTSDTTYTFATPTDAQGKIVVFWLWIVMGDTAHTITFPPNITWITEPSLGANSQCMLAFMSTDNGTSWHANVQWEK